MMKREKKRQKGADGAKEGKVEAIKRKEEEELEINDNDLIRTQKQDTGFKVLLIHSFTKYVMSTFYMPGPFQVLALLKSKWDPTAA